METFDEWSGQIVEPITDLRSHVKTLNEPLKYVQQQNGYDTEFDFIERVSQEPEYNSKTLAADLPENIDKNRYTNVKPPDNSRVKLREIQSIPGSDYINANKILGLDGKSTGYVTAQGPMDNTIFDFWRMIWEQSIYVMVMLTREIENGRCKCSRYWPEPTDPQSTLSFFNFKITLLSSKTEVEDLMIRILQVQNIEVPTSEPRTIVHFQYTGWPDHGIPASTFTFTKLAELVDQAIENKGGPIGVHCSAGIGRTGTFCTVHINIHILRDYFKAFSNPLRINIVNTVLALRKQRPGMVQTKDQFVFCYQAILDEYIRLEKEAKYLQNIDDISISMDLTTTDAGLAMSEENVPEVSPLLADTHKIMTTSSTLLF